MSLKPNHFKQFVLEIYDKFECPKQAINGFIVLLGKSHITKHQHLFESDYDIVANELIHCDEDVHIKGIYKDNNDTKSVNLLNLNGNDLQYLIHEAQHNTTEPMSYKLSIDRNIPMYENMLSIHRKLYDIAKMEVYELHRKIEESNPECELVGVKPDCLVYNNITNQPSTCTKWRVLQMWRSYYPRMYCE